MRRILSCAVLAVLLSSFVFADVGNANAEAIDEYEARLPELLSHSKPKLSAFQGDSLELAVKTNQTSGANIRWIHNNKTLCRKMTCQFDTAKWSLGRHRLVALIYNRSGSRSVEFRIKVLVRASKTEPQQLVPEMVNAEKVETLKSDDLFARSFVGIGYSFHSKKVQVVGRYPRLVNWDEKLKSHRKGVIQVGRRRGEEHFVLPESTVVLAKTSSGRRVLKLLRGDLRSRQIAETEPSWSILVGDWLQVDTDQHGDVLVLRDDDRVTIMNLRGYARVLYRVGEQAALEQGQAFVIPPNAQVVFRADHGPGGYERIDYRKVRKRFFRSSPQYFLKKSKRGKKGAFLSAGIRDHKNMSLQVAVKQAVSYLERQDSLMALEHLLPVHKKGREDFDYHMALGRAYFNLSLLREANKAFKKAESIDPTSPDAPYAVAMLHVESRNWAKVVDWLDKADERDHPNWQSMNYYRGVAHYNLEELSSARANFRYSLWEIRNRDMELSARRFLLKIGDDRPWGVVGFFHTGYDSNVYRIASQNDLDEFGSDLGPVASAYFRGGASFYYTGFSSDEGRLRFAYDIDNTIPQEKSHLVIAPLWQRFYLDWRMLSLNKEGDVGFEARLLPYLGLLMLGDERSDDIFGLDTYIAFPSTLMGLFMKLNYALHTDPLPGRDDKLDPIRRQPVAASDRSGNEILVGLGSGLFDTESLDSKMGIDYTMMTYSNENVETDNFTELKVTIDSDYRWTPRFVTKFDLMYAQVDYPDSGDGRKDSLYGSGLDLQYHYTPSFYNSITLDYESQSSNRSVNTYARYDIGLLFSLEL